MTSEYKWATNENSIGVIAQSIQFNEAMRLDSNNNLGIGTSSMHFYTTTPSTQTKILVKQNIVMGMCIEHLNAEQLLNLALNLTDKLKSFKEMPFKSTYVENQIKETNEALDLVTTRMDSLA